MVAALLAAPTRAAREAFDMTSARKARASYLPDAPAAAPVHVAPEATLPVLPDALLLRALALRARTDDDPALRALVEGYITMRRALGDVLTCIAARDGGVSVARTPVLRQARALVEHAHAVPLRPSGDGRS